MSVPLCPTIPHLSTPGLHLLRRQLAAVRAAAGDDGGPAARRERQSLPGLVSAAQSERQPGREAVARAVRVLDRPGLRRGLEGAARLGPAAERAGGRDDEPWRRLDLAGQVALTLVEGAADEPLQLHPAPPPR